MLAYIRNEELRTIYQKMEKFASSQYPLTDMRPFADAIRQLAFHIDRLIDGKADIGELTL